MSSSRRTDDTTRIRKGSAYGSDLSFPKSKVELSSKGVLSDTRRKTSEAHQQIHGRRTNKTDTTKGASDEDAQCVTTHCLSEITRTNEFVSPSDKKEIQGVLRLPESVRNVTSPKRGPTRETEKHIVKDGVNMNEISACETDLNNLVSHWSGDTVKFQRVTEIW